MAATAKGACDWRSKSRRRCDRFGQQAALVPPLGRGWRGKWLGPGGSVILSVRLIEHVGAAHRRGGTLKEAFEATHAALAPKFGHWPIFEHCLPFDVQRLWDEFDGIDWPRIWTMERDREVWEQLQG